MIRDCAPSSRRVKKNGTVEGPRWPFDRAENKDWRPRIPQRRRVGRLHAVGVMPVGYMIAELGQSSCEPSPRAGNKG